MDNTCPLCCGDGFVVITVAYNKRKSICTLCKGSGVYNDKYEKVYGYVDNE